MEDRYTGKVAFVTGAASGIGQAVARRVASEGGAVACVDLSADGAEATASGIRDAGGRAAAIACDVTDEASVRAAVAATVAELGAPTVVCNIAGIAGMHHSHELSLEVWNRFLAVNLTGTFLVCRETLPHLLTHRGVIVNTASNAGLEGLPYGAAYCASKGGVVQLTRALAWEYIKSGVRVNAVAPGGVETPLTNNFAFPEGEIDWKLIDKIQSPLGMSKPEEIAGLFAYLGSDEARYVTGSIMSIDGGLTC